MTTSTAAELARFAQLHLNSGQAPGGEQVISRASVDAMQQPQLSMPPTSTSPLTQGIGWLMQEWDGKKVIGHGGGTIGQLSFLQVVPEEKLVVVLLTNSATGGLMWRDLGGWLFEALAGIKMPAPPEAPETVPDLPLARYVGTYERLGERIVVAEEGGALVIRIELVDLPGELQPLQPPPPMKLRPIDRERFTVQAPGANDVAVFLEFERGQPGYLFLSGRAARRKARRAIQRRQRAGPAVVARGPK